MLHCKISNIFTSLLLALAVGVSVCHAGKGIINDSNLFLQGENWEFKNPQNQLNINNNIKVTSPDFTLFSDNLVAHFAEPAVPTERIDASARELKEFMASGKVRIEFKNGYTTMSDQAKYFKNQSKIVLTGNAQIISGKNTVKGCSISYLLETESYTIDSCSDQQATGNIKGNDTIKSTLTNHLNNK